MALFIGQAVPNGGRFFAPQYLFFFAFGLFPALWFLFFLYLLNARRLEPAQAQHIENFELLAVFLQQRLFTVFFVVVPGHGRRLWLAGVSGRGFAALQIGLERLGEARFFTILRGARGIADAGLLGVGRGHGSRTLP